MMLYESELFEREVIVFRTGDRIRDCRFDDCILAIDVPIETAEEDCPRFFRCTFPRCGDMIELETVT